MSGWVLELRTPSLAQQALPIRGPGGSTVSSPRRLGLPGLSRFCPATAPQGHARASPLPSAAPRSPKSGFSFGATGSRSACPGSAQHWQLPRGSGCPHGFVSTLALAPTVLQGTCTGELTKLRECAGSSFSSKFEMCVAFELVEGCAFHALQVPHLDMGGHWPTAWVTGGSGLSHTHGS